MDRFFGYGSLVNRATQDYPNGQPARLPGWRRVWRRTVLRDEAFLSVRPDPGCTIEGLVADVPGGDWAALDARETGYARHAAETSVGAVEVYAVAPQSLSQSQEIKVLMSYLDVVVQGFVREFGAAGVARFFQTTEGWGEMIDDRAAPLYPRAQVLTHEERALVDHWLARL